VSAQRTTREFGGPEIDLISQRLNEIELVF